MKKKNKNAQKNEMPEFEFKEFSPEEGRIYEEAVSKFREAISAGKSLRAVYESYSVADKELEKLIQADFLKILIAERHFGQRQPLEEIARDLDVQPEILKETLSRMLQEVGVSAANKFGLEFGGFEPKTND